MDTEGYTVTQLMEKTGKSRSAIMSILSRYQIKPLSYEARYPPETVETIMQAKVGRPPKTKPETNVGNF